MKLHYASLKIYTAVIVSPWRPFTWDLARSGAVYEQECEQEEENEDEDE